MKPTLAAEAKQVLTLSLPILGTQLAQTANGLVDTVMAGHASALDLAGVAVGSSFWVPLYLFMAGVLLGITPILSKLFGQNKLAPMKAYMHQGFWLATLMGLISFALLRSTDPILTLMIDDEALADVTQGYLNALSWGMPAMALYMVLRCLSESFQKAKPVFVTSLLGLLLNIPLNYVFIYGYGPISPMGGVGCGWATTIVMWFMLLLMLGHVILNPRYQPLKMFTQWSYPEYKTLRSILQVGFPIGLAIFFEVSIFAIIALLIADFGAETVAGHQITQNFSSLLFMLPLSVGLALTIRVGYFQGKEDPGRTKTTIQSGMIINAFLAINSISIVLLGRHWIPQWYSNEVAVTQMASALLLWVALYQMADAIQVAGQGILRGFKDTKMPMLITLFSYWCVGLPTGHFLATGQFFSLGLPVSALGPHGYWLGICVGLIMAAVLMSIRVSNAYRRLNTPLPTP